MSKEKQILTRRVSGPVFLTSIALCHTSTSPGRPLFSPDFQDILKSEPLPTLSFQTPRHTMVVDFDDKVVPTSQPSQDLMPYIMSPPCPGGTVLKDPTPKALRQSQGYIDEPTQTLPSLLAAIQARDNTGAKEVNVAYTSQTEKAELRSPQSVLAGMPFSSPPQKCDKAALVYNELPSSEQTGVFKTPKKLTSVPLGEIVNVMRCVNTFSLSSKFNRSRNPQSHCSTPRFPQEHLRGH